VKCGNERASKLVHVSAGPDPSLGTGWREKMSEPITERKYFNYRWLEEQWIKSADKVYRRERLEGEEWSEWELTVLIDLPFIQIKNSGPKG
jgi:hypothetical protein